MLLGQLFDFAKPSRKMPRVRGQRDGRHGRKKEIERLEHLLMKKRTEIAELEERLENIKTLQYILKVLRVFHENENIVPDAHEFMFRAIGLLSEEGADIQHNDRSTPNAWILGCTVENCTVEVKNLYEQIRSEEGILVFKTKVGVRVSFLRSSGRTEAYDTGMWSVGVLGL